MIAKRIVTNLAVADVQPARRIYQDILGLEVTTGARLNSDVFGA